MTNKNTVSFEELVDFLEAKEEVILQANPLTSIAEISERVLPEMTEDDHLALEEMAISLFPVRLLEGVPWKSAVAEIFLRGVELGREVQRRVG